MNKFKVLCEMQGGMSFGAGVPKFSRNLLPIFVAIESIGENTNNAQPARPQQNQLRKEIRADGATVGKNQWMTAQQERIGQLKARVSRNGGMVSQSPSIDGMNRLHPNRCGLNAGAVGGSMLHVLHQVECVEEVVLAFDALAGCKHLNCTVLAISAQGLSFPD